MNRDCGDNIVCTFGTDANPSMLVARAISNLEGVPTTFAVREQIRLAAMYGNPKVQPLFVSADTTFDMICDDLVEHGWYLFDWVPNLELEVSDPWTGTNRFHEVTFCSTFTNAWARMPVHADDVHRLVSDFESSGCWAFAGSKVL